VYPLSDSEVLNILEETIISENAKNDGKIKLCFMDAISSVPAVRFPFESAVKLVREHNILSLVDGAHTIGKERQRFVCVIHLSNRSNPFGFACN
jgi:selenocysteine lyase/cysteine desulfurase